ncbi:MAG TPA: CcmD family protein [Vicinamibacterales bacterium]|nr:CcmD family protein [Vicinamibacterales bacterium]
MRVTGTLVRVVAVALGLAVVAAVGVLAQEPQTQFVPADTLPQETLPATPLVFAAYAFAWVALVGYVFALWRKIGRVERELADVRSALARRQG